MNFSYAFWARFPSYLGLEGASDIIQVGLDLFFRRILRFEWRTKSILLEVSNRVSNRRSVRPIFGEKVNMRSKRTGLLETCSLIWALKSLEARTTSYTFTRMEMSTIFYDCALSSSFELLKLEYPLGIRFCRCSRTGLPAELKGLNSRSPTSTNQNLTPKRTVRYYHFSP